MVQIDEPVWVVSVYRDPFQGHQAEIATRHKRRAEQYANENEQAGIQYFASLQRAKEAWGEDLPEVE